MEELEFDLSDFLKYKQYFNTIATESKDIDGYIFGDVEIGQSEAGGWQNKKLWAWPADRSRMQDVLSDNYLLLRDGEIWVGGPCASELHEDKDTFYNACEVIMKKVVGRMIKDKADAKISVIFNNNNLERAEMDLSGTKFIGCRYTFQINDPTGFEYDEDDWEVTP